VTPAYTAAVHAPAEGPPRLTVLGQVTAPGPDGRAPVPVSGLGANLLVALALEPGRGLGAARVVDEVWPDAPPASGRAALQTLVSRLRSAHAPGLVVSTATGYALGLDARDVDLHRASAAVEQARTALAADRAVEAARLTADALALWVGEPGTGASAEHLVDALGARADAVRRDLLRLRAQALLALGDDAAVGVTAALADLAPLDDGAHLLRMRALHAAGRTSEAVAAFAEYRERLRDTLGTDPAPEVATFHVELLAHPAAAGPAERPVHPAATATAASPRVHGLRLPPNALIGRDDDVAAVEAMLDAAPVVTVLGPGGMGKTRLVQEVARRSVGRYPAVYVTELSAVREPGDVGPALAESLRATEATARLGVMEAHSRILRDRVLDRLAEQPTLLVLDNCEHVLDEVGAWVADLVASMPDVQVLATSRAPLGVAGERVHPLDPLPALTQDGSVGAAVRLFTERATAVRPSVSLPQEVVVRLCARLDGLPLALELAAARTRSLTVEEVERRLSDRFALLVGGGAGVPERHRTLRAVIEWSWDLLTERQRVLARRVAQLPDGFALDAAVALVAGARGGPATETEVLDDLDTLVAQSLLRVQEHRETGTMRYRMLETVRQFGDAEVDRAGERAEVTDRLLDWGRDLAVQVVRTARTPERLLLDPVGDRERDNLVAVLRLGLDRPQGVAPRPDALAALFAVLGPRWMMQAAHEELAEVQGRVLEELVGWRPSVAAAEPLVLALGFIAVVELSFGTVRNGARARAALRRAVAGMDLDPVPRLFADVVEHCVDAVGMAEVLSAARASTDRDARRVALFASWTIAENDGDIEAAVRYEQAAHALGLEDDDLWTQALSAVSLAGAYAQSLRVAESLHWVGVAQQTVDGLRAASISPLVDVLEEGLRQVHAFALLAEGEHDEAERMFLGLAAAAPDDERDAVLPGGLGAAEAMRARGETEAALLRLRELVGQAGDADPYGDPWFLLIAAACLAAHVLEGRTDEPGLAAMAEAMRSAGGRPNPGGPRHTDRPVLGAALVGLGAWRTAADPTDPTGLLMLALAEVMQSRQDVPATARAVHWERARAVYGEAAIERARARVAGWTHEEHPRRAAALLRGEVGDGPDGDGDGDGDGAAGAAG
jgi:predicted ATPase/DNA-binding SARP family transcriptional activator/tetratricopeptide (TPR) repeat protein